MPSNVILRCEGVQKLFWDRQGTAHTALNGIDFELQKGEFVILIGPSGCGKSTFLNLMAGFEKPTAGKVTINGSPVTGPGPDKAMVFQDYALLPWLDARGNVEIGLRLKGMPKAKRARVAMEYLDLVGLKHVADRPIYKMSGGMQQRVSIARALALQPDVLLMDEPFGALDAIQRSIMHKELTRIWRETGASIVFVTHSLDEAVFLADRVIAMSGGNGRLSGELAVDLPRPRDPVSPEFNQLKRRLAAMLPDEGAAAALVD